MFLRIFRQIVLSRLNIMNMNEYRILYKFHSLETEMFLKIHRQIVPMKDYPISYPISTTNVVLISFKHSLDTHPVASSYYELSYRTLVSCIFSYNMIATVYTVHNSITIHTSINITS